MNRRRMMMLQQSKPDLLKGYRQDNMGGTYHVYIEWLTDDIVQMYHNKDSFAGPSKIAKGFINTRDSSTAYGVVLGTTPMDTLELGKTYRLTLIVTEVLKNTANADNDGDFLVAFGRNGRAATQIRKLSEITVGTTIEITQSYASTWGCISGAGIEVTNPGLLWDFKFNVTLEEV